LGLFGRKKPAIDQGKESPAAGGGGTAGGGGGEPGPYHRRTRGRPRNPRAGDYSHYLPYFAERYHIRPWELERLTWREFAILKESADAQLAAAKQQAR
jgi:hypothetical protein